MTREQTPADVRRIVGTLNRHGVDYILIGGEAARLQGATRPTFDVDVVAATGADNLTRLAVALKELGALFVGTPTQPISFADLALGAAEADYDGVVVLVASLDDLIRAKELADRPKDHEALPELRLLRDAEATRKDHKGQQLPEPDQEPPTPGP